MRSILIVTAIAVTVCAACTEVPPRDLSNATLTSAQPRTPQNINVVREVPPSAFASAVLAQPDRTREDRALDHPRQAADLLAFVGVEPGMRVAQLGCGSGYFTELLARAAGPRGVVFAQNATGTMAPSVLAAWNDRLERPAMRNVTPVERGFALPLPPEVRDLDRVYLSVPYSVLTSLGVDRASMNRRVSLALRRGGRYVVLDRTQPPRPDPVEAHRQESRSARREIESAGFSFVTEGRFFRTSPDPNDWNGVVVRNAPVSGNDFFALVFEKR
jgi:predicted methyltransferase